MSFVVLGESYNGGNGSTMTVLGWRAGLVQYDPAHPAHWGTFLHGSDQAEREALLWAGLWRCCVNNLLPTTFVSDSQLTLQLSQGRSAIPPDQPTATLLRSIFQCLSQGLGHQHLSLHHTFGHSGDTWNEVADELASLARDGFPVRPWEIDLRDHVARIPFWWMATDKGGPTAGLTQHGFAVPAPSCPPHTSPLVSTNTVSETSVTVDVTFVSANVNSLYSSEHGFSGKLAYLSSQFFEQKITFVGIQESRTPRGYYRTQDYIRFCSGASQGLCGIELWVSTSLPYAWSHHERYFLKKDHCVVVAATPRTLLVHIVAPGLDLWILTGHAPHSGYDHEELSSWWEELQSILNQHEVSRNLVVLVDANATMGQVDGMVVVDSGTEPTTTSAFLHQFAMQHNLTIAGSLRVHQGTRNTWTTPDGLHSRDLDHILLSPSIFPACD